MTDAPARAPVDNLPLCGAPAQLAPDLTVSDVAAMLGCSTGYVCSEARRKRIAHARLGRYLRFRREWVEAYLASATVMPEGYAPATIPEAV